MVFVFYSFFRPLIRDKINKTIKIKNKILAILAAPAAIPPNPKIPAIIARIINVTVHLNIIIFF
ncbi:hypothetical protein LPBF_09450 [Flavobacterium crassostreae]|uniref:Uncharacterized protein n=1 Tax=Flavobacterium crassostreae TaxID=1763534 RepID=A0A1B9DYS2_9FLAO|nr:hypothetical protein LPBF_09450 [Flavobacterium crassostreae]